MDEVRGGVRRRYDSRVDDVLQRRRWKMTLGSVSQGQ